jgi:hypothetical protein
MNYKTKLLTVTLPIVILSSKFAQDLMRGRTNGVVALEPPTSDTAAALAVFVQLTLLVTMITAHNLS